MIAWTLFALSSALALLLGGVLSRTLRREAGHRRLTDLCRRLVTEAQKDNARPERTELGAVRHEILLELQRLDALGDLGWPVEVQPGTGADQLAEAFAWAAELPLPRAEDLFGYAQALLAARERWRPGMPKAEAAELLEDVLRKALGLARLVVYHKPAEPGDGGAQEARP